jgi:hypothetical protein
MLTVSRTDEPMSVTFSYELTGRGWAECSVRIGEKVTKVSASYLSDALADLASATAAALRGHPAACASFAEEPGEYRWILEPRVGGQVRVRVLEFPEFGGRQPDDEGIVLLDGECRLRTFAGAIVSELQRLEAKHGQEGYRRVWGKHEFPAERLVELQALLKGAGGERSGR